MKALQWLTDHMDMATEEQRARIDALRTKAVMPEDESKYGVVILPEIITEDGGDGDG